MRLIHNLNLINGYTLPKFKQNVTGRFREISLSKKEKKSPKKTKKIVVTPKVEELQSSFTYQKIAFHESFPKVVRKVF